jgi:hypothetical protein
MRARWWAALLLLCFTQRGLAQAPLPGSSGLSGPRLQASWMQAAAPERRPARLDLAGARAVSRGMKGALVGAVVLGTAAAMLRASMCERGESCAGPVLMWGLMAGTVGAAVGGLAAGSTE